MALLGEGDWPALKWLLFRGVGCKGEDPEQRYWICVRKWKRVEWWEYLYDEMRKLSDKRGDTFFGIKLEEDNP